MEIINIADLPHPEHDGKTYREVNNETTHNIPVGKLVEITSDYDDEYSGMRLYVVGHHRDCDGTPLYCLGKKGAEMYDNGRYFNFSGGGKFFNPKTIHGFSEGSLKKIEPKQTEDKE